MKKALFLNIGWEQLPLLLALSQKNYEIYGVGNNAPKDAEPLLKRLINCDISNMNAILAFANQINPDLVVSDQDDYAYFVQALVADKYRLPGPSLAEAQLAINKYKQRSRLTDISIKQPTFFKVEDLSGLSNAVRHLGFPLIVKPVDSRGSYGVTKVNEQSFVEEAFYSALSYSPSRACIIEQFIQGQEITVDGYMFNGTAKSLALASKSKLDSEVMVSMDIKYPGELDHSVYQRALALNEKIANYLYSFGFTHAEFIATSEGELYLVEIANRGGGCCTSELIVPAVSGVNLLEQYIADCAGDDADLSLERTDAQEVILKFLSFAPGRVRGFVGSEDIIKNDSVILFRLNVEAGDKIKAIDSDASRHGFVIIKSPRDVRKTCNEILSQFKVLYE